MTTNEFLEQLADALDGAVRRGEAEDVAEGDRFICMSDTAARELASECRKHVEK